MGYSYTVQRSPNQSSRSSYGYGPTPTGITIHWWGSPGAGFTHSGVVSWLCNPNSGVSAHEVISDGRVTHLVDFDRAAWHAGSTEGNGRTIGLECRPQMTAGDLETLAQRCADIENDLGRSMYYYGHQDWRATQCPGTYYDRIGWLVKRVNEIHSGVEDDVSYDDAYRAIDDFMKNRGHQSRVPGSDAKLSVLDMLLNIDMQAYELDSDRYITPWDSNTGNKTWTLKNALESMWAHDWRTEKALAALAERQGVDVDEEAIAASLLSALTPEKIAAAISDDVAGQVVDELNRRLAA